MQMTDLMPVEGWLALEQEIHQRYGLNARVYDDKGFTFTGSLTWCNRICPAIKAKPQGVQAICSVAHMAMAAEARQGGGPVVGECDAGLLKISVPVLVDGEFIGVVGGCGRLLDEGEVDPYMVEMSAGIPEAEVTELCTDLTAMTSAEAEAAAEEIKARVDAIIAEYRARRA